MIKRITHRLTHRRPARLEAFLGRRPLFFLYLTVFINMVGFGMVFPLLPLYAKQFNATAFEIGLLATSFSIVQFLTSPILGRISDRFGRKPVLFWGLIGAVFSMLAAGFANSLGVLFVARSLHGAVSSAIIPTARAYMADVTTQKERIAGMGKVGAAFSLGFLVGPAFGSFLAGLGGAHVPFFAAAGVALINALSVLIFLRESLTVRAEKLVLREGLFNVLRIIPHLKSEPGILFAILFAWSFGLSNNQVAFPLLVDERFSLGVEHTGYFFTALALVSASVQGWFLPRIVEALGEKRTIVVGMTFQGLGLALVAFAPTVVLLGVSFMLAALGSALNRPTAEGVISRLSHTGQGTALGIANSFESLGRVFGPLMGGLLYGLGAGYPFLVSAVLLWILGIFVIQALRIKEA